MSMMIHQMSPGADGKEPSKEKVAKKAPEKKATKKKVAKKAGGKK